MLPASIFLALTFWISPTFSDSETASVFTQALQSFKQGELAKSRDSFLQLLSTHPDDPVLLYNLGLTEMTDQHPGRALAYWRKALYLDPGFSPAVAGLTQLAQLKKFDFTPSLSEQIHWRLSLTTFLAALWLTCLFSGLWLLRWARSRKELSEENSRSTSAVPLWPVFISGLFSLVFLFLASQRFWRDHYQVTGTVLASSAPVYASPSVDSPALFDFKEGDEVRVHRSKEGWLQVQRGDTAAGWVKKDEVLVYAF